MAKIKDITGEKYGRLTPLYVIGRTKHGAAIWRCRCDCGKEKDVSIGPLTSKTTISCGCFAKENIAKRNADAKSHGESKTRLYGIWSHMKQRCYNPNNPEYELYGERGISVCNEWRESYEKFRDWSIANGYREDLTIDRIDVNGGYEPSNCRWATPKQQANNRRDNAIIKAFGIEKNIKEWSEEAGISYTGLRYRLDAGWSAERAISQECNRSKSLLEWNNAKKRLLQL